MRLERFLELVDEETRLIERKVHSSTYNFTSYREKLILKGASRFPRQISIPTIRDRLTLRATCNCLSDLIPDARTLPPHNYIKSIAELIKGSGDPLSFLRVDVRDFFPTVGHDLLLSCLANYGAEPFFVDLIRKAITNWTGFGGKEKSNPIGIPQGLSISNILSSIYMTEFDRIQKSMGNYHRYVDDILIVAPSHLVTARYKSVHAGLLSIGLNPHTLGSAGKTEIKRISEGIDYLGYHLTPSAVSVRTSSYHRMFSNLNKVFTSFKYRGNLTHFLFKLNLRITGCIVDGKRKGWLMFFSQTDDISQLKYLDQFVERQCRRFNVDTSVNTISRFVKTYHEIRYKGNSSGYIPNFDSYSLDQQYQVIATLTGATLEELNSRSVEATDKEFKALVAKEVSDLEQDVLESIS